ncbi:response regulator [Spirosoma pollinicola]|uniref:Response regulator n=1 Tax=Spirosoma pollinicola TaxID=2057025 RepID=A0A2K8Z8Y3_9BACT|nr:response regulator [Spirosoma pollinicola]AUD06327.1 response regulator [Spirosoma pollinicola]
MKENSVNSKRMLNEQTIILVTDDDDDDRYFLRQAIERTVSGVTVLEAKNGEEALNLLAGRLIHLVILDMNMPGLNGLEILSFIRLHADLYLTPAVMLSTSDQASLVADAYKKGINCYIKKPAVIWEYDQIAAALKTCFLTISP